MRKHYLEQALALTMEQTRALQYRDLEMFSKAVNEKQEIINALEQIKLETTTPLSEEEKDIVKKIAEIDESNIKEYHLQFDQTKAEIRRFRQLKRRDHYYNNGYDISREEGIFFDKK